MMRFLGVLVGSALAVGALVIFVGIPRFTAEETVAENTIITLPKRQTKRVEAPPDAAGETRNEPGSGFEPRPEADKVDGEAGATVAAEAGTPKMPRQADPYAEQLIDPPVVSQTTEPVRQWYAFWSPFRSRLAANGFVEQLQRVTGLDYRVVTVKPGVYEVAFAYQDATDIDTSLAEISAATGLELPES